MTDPARDPYAVLGVPRGASDRQIVAAHRALARRFHPDIAGDAATAEMVRINAALEQIRTADRRARGNGPTRDRLRGTQRDGTGGAGPPPGRPSGSVLGFGRHIGWSMGEIARVDPGYLEWLSARPEGQPYVAEIDALLRRTGFRTDPAERAGAARGRGR